MTAKPPASVYRMPWYPAGSRPCWHGLLMRVVRLDASTVAGVMMSHLQHRNYELMLPSGRLFQPVDCLWSGVEVGLAGLSSLASTATGVNVLAMRTSKCAAACNARGVAVWAARRAGSAGYIEIGRGLGIPHSTAIGAEKRFAKRLAAADPDAWLAASLVAATVVRLGNGRDASSPLPPDPAGRQRREP